MALRALLAALVSLTLAAAGCRVFDESLLDEEGGVDASILDAGDAGPDAGPPEDGGCRLRHPPGRPAGADPMETTELAFALRDLVLDQRGVAWMSIGYDLDDRCSQPLPPTEDGGAPVWDIECEPPSDSASPETDGMEGIDNSFGHNFPLLLFAFVPNVQESLETEQLAGRGLVLLRVRGWNGEDDDPRVEVVVSTAVRTDPAEGDVPQWDGTDVFIPSVEDFVGGDPTRPATFNDNAYVSGRTLVVALPDRSELVWAGDGLTFSLVLTDPVITGRISDDASRLEDVTVFGRWPRLDLLEAFEGLGFCAGSENRMTLERLLDNAADVRQDSTTAGPGVDCDAVSVAIRMTGYGGVWGDLAAPSPPPSPCP